MTIYHILAHDLERALRFVAMLGGHADEAARQGLEQLDAAAKASDEDAAEVWA